MESFTGHLILQISRNAGYGIQLEENIIDKSFFSVYMETKFLTTCDKIQEVIMKLRCPNKILSVHPLRVISPFQ